jgi:hypothetical protein
MKSEVSLFRCLAFVSLSVCSMVLVYKLGRDQSLRDTMDNSSPLTNKRIALKEGQTIIGVSDSTKIMRFYIRNNVVDH